jgi:hypothetical protein
MAYLVIVFNGPYQADWTDPELLRIETLNNL